VTPTVRRARPEDTSQLFDLIRAHAAFERSSASITASDLARLLHGKRPPVQLFVAERTTRIVGYAALTIDYSLWRASRWAHLDCLFVDEAERGKGTGGLLLECLTEAARSLRADRLEWQTPQWNHNAMRFYRRQNAVEESKARFHLELK
jgi:GNAT superfamily N-acetyltransferase